MTLKEAYIAFINLPMVLTRIADNYLEYKTGETTITYFSDKTLSLDRTGIFDSRFYVLSACSDSDIVEKIERLVRFDKKYEGGGLSNLDILAKLEIVFNKIYDDYNEPVMYCTTVTEKGNAEFMYDFKSSEWNKVPSDKSLPTQENELPTVDVTSRNFDRIINYVLKKQQIYSLHKIYDNGLEFSAPGMFFGTIVAYDDDSKTVQVQHTRFYCNGRKTFIDQPYNVIGEYICELLNPHARLGAIVYEPIKEEKEIEHIVTPSTNYYLFRGLKTSN